MTGLPEWWEPLRSRVEAAQASDFTAQLTPGEGARSSAVLVLLGEEAAQGPDVLVLMRAATLRNHADQAAFPGGVADPGDENAAATALREANEEVGLDRASVQIVASLPTLWIPVSNFLVTPILAWWRTPHPVGPADPGEVARVVRVPIAELVDPAHRLRVRHPSGWVGPAFRLRGMLIWGFTAGVLSTLLEMGGWARDWSADRVEEMPVVGPTPVP